MNRYAATQGAECRLYCRLLSILGVTVVTIIWQRFGGDAGTMYIGAVASGTVFGTMAGTLIVPRDQRRFASQGFAGIFVAAAALLLILSVAHHMFKVINIFDVVGSLLGGWLVLRNLRRFGITSKPTLS